MTDKNIAERFNMPTRTLARYKAAPQGSWRKNIYYLMLEDIIRSDKRKES